MCRPSCTNARRWPWSTPRQVWLDGGPGHRSKNDPSKRLDCHDVRILESDLFWAIKGAGQNFGIVTEVKYRIYDVDQQTWAYEFFTFSSDKLEALYEQSNRMMKDQPPHVIHWTFMLNIPQIDTDHVRQFFVTLTA